MGAVKPPLLDEVLRLPFAVTPNATIIETWWPPGSVEVGAVEAHIATAAVSAAGTYLLTVSLDGKNLLLPVSFNLQSLASGVVTDVPLTQVLADRRTKRKKKLVVTVASNNADLTGAGLVLHVVYRRT